MRNLTPIAIFVRVVADGSFTAAADRLGMSRPTVSRGVSTLERQLGVRLLNRTTRRVGLTEAGKRFYGHCRRILEELDAATCEVTRLNGLPGGRLRISAPTAFGDRYLTDRIREFLELYPDVEIELTLDNSRPDLIDDGYDVAICVAEQQPPVSNARRLGGCERLVCAAPEYLARFGAPRSPADLAGHNCLCFANGNFSCDWRLDGPGGCETTTVRSRFRTDHGDVLRIALLSGMGLALVPLLLVSNDLEAGRLRDVLPRWRDNSHGIYAISVSGADPAPNVRAFLDHLDAHLSEPSI